MLKIRNTGSAAFLTAAVLFLFLAGSAFGQAGTSGISGTITDQASAAVPGATVRISNPDTGFSRSVTTSADGKYGFPGIPPATYRMEVEAASFKKLVNSNVKALVDSPIEVNLALEPGDVTAVVDVTSNTIESVINTQDASLGNNFVPQQITQLPTDLRRVADLLSLQPGVTREGYVAGGRSDQANVLLDGVDINDQQNGGRTGQFQTSQDTVLRATAESVEEFRITTSNPDASQGRSSGAQISLITRSGTNNFRGSLFYFYRPTAFSANNFFNNSAGVYTPDEFVVQSGLFKAGEEKAPRPSLARDIFGGSIGGPIIKDKLFFFYTYEGQRQQQGVSVVRTVPMAHVGQGILRFSGSGPSCTGGLCSIGLAELNTIYSEVGINPIAMQFLASAAQRYPVNDDTVGDGVNTGGYRFNSPTDTEENTHITRLDYKLTDSQSLYFRANFQRDHLTGTSQFPDTPAGTSWDHPWGMVAGHDWAISANMVNNFRYGFTRQAFSTTGDSTDNTIFFRFVFQPLAFTRTLSRITPTHNITDDFTWIQGNHTWRFGGNVRVIRNKRLDYASAYDTAITNPSFYNLSGRVLDLAVSGSGYSFARSQRTIIQNTAAALIGRYSDYSGSYTFDIDGNPLDQGTPTDRNFATEEYDLYVQDAWKLRRDLTLTLGVRYGLSRPVYEKTGFQVVPTEPLGDFFERRKAAAAQGIALNDLITFERGGPANSGPGFYKMDWKNWQPSISAAWSPSFKSGFLGNLFGKNGESVFRGGFRILSDHFGGQLAVSFSGLSTIGFTEEIAVAANSFDITNCAPSMPGGPPNCGPLFTGLGQQIRGLPYVPLSPAQGFQTPADEAQRIESSLDATIKTPKHYTWNFSYGRKLPGGLYLEASYLGRKARNLLAARDVMALNDLVDPGTGMDWYTAAGMLHTLRAADTPLSAIPNIPYFNHFFPNAGASLAVFWDDTDYAAMTPTQAVYYMVARDGYDILDWTFVQSALDDDYSGAGAWSNLFFHPQYAAFSAFSSAAKSDYHGATFTLRQRLGDTLTYDINYTWAKSFDNASGLQTGGSYGSQFILNPLRPQDNYSVSDFDIRHSVNANFIFQLPFGQGKHWFSDLNGFTDALIGGWQLSGIARWNTGLPAISPFDAAQWATNWNAQSSGVRVRNVPIQVNRNTQNAFGDPQAAYNAWRNARPGETGDRNAMRLPGYSTLDLGLSKSFTMPWSEGHKLQFRWEVINVFNYQYFDGQNGNLTRSTWGLQQDSDIGEATSDFGKIFTDIQGVPRRMQFGLRYSF
ncbi:MAG: TonB-dependent receptor [Acidobacteria bacterium]|nr:TonB-dependent receptor [Acidobacteriota bacterium]